MRNVKAELAVEQSLLTTTLEHFERSGCKQEFKEIKLFIASQKKQS